MDERQLIDYLPPVMGDLRETKALMAAEQPEVEAAWGAAEAAQADQFVVTATDAGLRRRESMLQLMPKAMATIEERRFAILARLSEVLPFTMNVLRQQIEALVGADYTAVLGHYELIVRLFLTSKESFDDVGKLLRRMVPANIRIDYALKYNRHSLLAGFTHAELAAHTHNELRSEVLPDA